jgi:hypothetical protein
VVHVVPGFPEHFPAAAVISLNGFQILGILTFRPGFIVQFNLYTPRACAFIKSQSIMSETQFKPPQTPLRNQDAHLFNPSRATLLPFRAERVLRVFHNVFTKHKGFGGR